MCPLLAFAGGVNQVIIGGLVGTTGVADAMTIGGNSNSSPRAASSKKRGPAKPARLRMARAPKLPRSRLRAALSPLFRQPVP